MNVRIRKHIKTFTGRLLVLEYHPSSVDAHYVDMYEVVDNKLVWKVAWYVKEFMDLPHSGRFDLRDQDMEPLKRWVTQQALDRPKYWWQ